VDATWSRVNDFKLINVHPRSMENINGILGDVHRAYKLSGSGSWRFEVSL